MKNTKQTHSAAERCDCFYLFYFYAVLIRFSQFLSFVVDHFELHVLYGTPAIQNSKLLLCIIRPVGEGNV